MPATCVAPGTAAHKKCANCQQLFDINGNKIDKALELPVDKQNGHKWGEPTYKNNGDGTHTATYACANECGDTKSDAPAEHVYGEDDKCVCGNVIVYVAQIGEKKYESLVEAFAAGGAITLLADVEVTEYLIVDTGAEVVLDLNGKTITAIGDLGRIINVREGGTLTINATNGGAVTHTLYAIVNYGTLVVNGGTFTGEYALHNGSYTNKATATLNGGTFNALVEDEVSVANCANMIVNGATVNGWLATSGAFTIESGNVEVLWANEPDAEVAAGTSTTVNGGTFEEIFLEAGKNFIACSEEAHEAIGALLAFDEGFVGKWLEAEGKFIAKEIPNASNSDAEIGGKYYETIEEAINDAQTGDTITLMGNAAITELEIVEDVKIDLNGNTLMTDALLMYDGEIVDSSADKSGVLHVAKGNLVVPETNPQVPVWNGDDGYVFASMKNQVKYARIEDNGNAFAISLKPSFGQVFNDSYLKNGSAAAAAKVTIKISWGVGEDSQIFEFSDALTAKVYGERLAFKLKVTGLFGYENLKAEVIVEGSGASYVVADYDLSAMIAGTNQ